MTVDYICRRGDYVVWKNSIIINHVPIKEIRSVRLINFINEYKILIDTEDVAGKYSINIKEKGEDGMRKAEAILNTFSRVLEEDGKIYPL